MTLVTGEGVPRHRRSTMDGLEVLHAGRTFMGSGKSAPNAIRQ
jgi:hypothetical protein